MLFNRIKGILFYEPKGKCGWSSYQPSTIDVADVISLSYNKRLFSLLDRESPYTLNIQCYNISTKTRLAPVITSKGIGLAFTQCNNFESIITRRFKTVDEISNEISKISNYQNLFDDYSTRIQLLE